MKPELGIVHHLQRTGGTLISKCVASLPNIALLSEVNPGTNFMVLDPVFQASFWLRLMTDDVAEQLKDAPFVEKIKVIHTLATKRGESLIIRNWAYLDFFGMPFTSAPSNALATAEVLEEHFDLRQIVTVRHPMDQWLSWRAYRGSAKASEFTFDAFIDACNEFKNKTSGMPCIRYEDFVIDPKTEMQSICEHLKLQFDPVFQTRWPYYHQITGDDNDRASGDWSISPRPRRKAEKELQLRAMANGKYVSLLNYYDYK